MVPACLLVRLLGSFPGLRGIPWGRELNWKMERQDKTDTEHLARLWVRRRGGQ